MSIQKRASSDSGIEEEPKRYLPYSDGPSVIFKPPPYETCNCSSIDKACYVAECKFNPAVNVTIIHTAEKYEIEWKRSESDVPKEIETNPSDIHFNTLMRYCRNLGLRYDTTTRLEKNFPLLFSQIPFNHRCGIWKVVIEYDGKAIDLSIIGGLFSEKTDIILSTSATEFDTEETFDWPYVVGFESKHPISAEVMGKLMKNRNLIYLNVVIDQSCRLYEGSQWNIHDALEEWSEGTRKIKHWNIISVSGGAVFPVLNQRRSRKKSAKFSECLLVKTTGEGYQNVLFELLNDLYHYLA